MMTTMNNTCIFINFKKYTLSEFFFENWICLYNTVFSERSVNNNNNICLKSNIQTSSVDYAPRELTHACSRSETCSRSDTEACDMCYVFNVNLKDSFDDRRSQCRLIE